MKTLVFKVKTNLQPVRTCDAASNSSRTKPRDNDVLAKVLCTVFHAKEINFCAWQLNFSLESSEQKTKSINCRIQLRNNEELGPNRGSEPALGQVLLPTPLGLMLQVNIHKLFIYLNVLSSHLSYKHMIHTWKFSYGHERLEWKIASPILWQ